MNNFIHPTSIVEDSVVLGNNNFIYSLKNWIGIFTLSNYISKYISSEFNNTWR